MTNLHTIPCCKKRCLSNRTTADGTVTCLFREYQAGNSTTPFCGCSWIQPPFQNSGVYLQIGDGLYLLYKYAPINSRTHHKAANDNKVLISQSHNCVALLCTSTRVFMSPRPKRLKAYSFLCMIMP
jgi:hypothetical protein